MKYITFSLKATGLLIVLSGDNFNAELVEGAKLDSNRDLIGFHDMADIQSQNVIPTMYPTAAAPTPYPVEALVPTTTEGRFEPQIEEAPTVAAQESAPPVPSSSAPVVPGAPTNR